MPFLLPALAILVGIGIFALAFIRRPWSRALMAVGAGIVALVVLFVAANESAWAGVNVNPVVTNAQSLQGRWAYGATSFELKADSSWRCLPGAGRDRPCTEAARTGRWQFHGSLELVDSAGRSIDKFPLIRDGDVYRLLIVPDEDPDSWNPRKGFERTSSSSR